MKKFHIFFGLKIFMLLLSFAMAIFLSFQREWGAVIGFGGIVIGMAICIIEDIKRLKTGAI